MSAAHRHRPAVGEIIREQRQVAELTLRQLADMVGISNPYLSQIERGLRAPSQHVLTAIAASLQTTADALVEQAGGTDDIGELPAALAAIRVDPHLSTPQREALELIYSAFVAARPTSRSDIGQTGDERPG